ncbi:protein turtle isoform X2 [Rhipicephalus microplus]|uniref:protein turtle isoform X2 n=1 Tax=Rhipicephalus microplus TaxID=6941 RepID=UPI003F6B0154
MQSSLAPLSWSVLSSAAATGLVVPFPCLRSCPTAHTAERRWLTVMVGTVVLALVSVAMARAGNATASPSEDEAIPQLYAAVGGKVSLPCNTSIPAGGDGVSLILWYHGDYGIPIYSLDARDQPLGKARHFPGQDLGTRAYLDVSSKPPTLNIDPVLESDAGEYRCRVDYSRQRTQHRNVNLTVIVPPKDAIIRDESGKPLHGVIGPYDEGAHLVLICDADGGRPAPAVTWWRGSELVDDKYALSPLDVVRNELVIKKLQRSDLLTTYTCQASNTNLTLPRSSSVTINMNLRPLDVRITTLKRPLSAHRKVELSCQSTGGRPAPQLTWWLGKKKLSFARDNVSVGDNVTTSTVSFAPNTDDHGKYLACRADNPLLSSAGLEDGWTLNIQYVPRLSLSLGANMKHKAIREGSDVYLECNIQANPAVSEVGWKFEGKPLYSNVKQGIIISNQSLVLQKVRRESRGHYQCVAANVEGEGESDRVLLRVHYAPVCKKRQNLVYGVARDEEAEISCEVEADPSELSFKWSLNNSVEVFDVKTFTVNGTTSVASYRPRWKHSYGLLYCWATNTIGMQREPCAFHIIPAVSRWTGPPEAVRNCRVSNQTSVSLAVECDPGDHGGLRQTFHLEVYNSALELLQRNLSSSEGASFVVRDLPPGTAFILVLYGSNSKGRSNSVSISTNTLPSPERRTANTDITSVSPVLGVLIGIVGALVLVAIVIVVVMRLRGDDSEKRATEESPEKNQNHQRKAVDDLALTDIDTKDPSVIQKTSDSQEYPRVAVRRIPTFPAHRTYDSFSPSDYNYENIQSLRRPSPVKMDNEVRYAELSLPRSKYPVRIREPPTDYAQIDFQRAGVLFSAVPPQSEEEDPCAAVGSDTPLMNSLQPNVRHLGGAPSDHNTISTPV